MVYRDTVYPYQFSKAKHKQYHHDTYKSSISGDPLVTPALVAFWSPSSTMNERYTYDYATMSWHMQLTTNLYVSMQVYIETACWKPNLRKVDHKLRLYVQAIGFLERSHSTIDIQQFTSWVRKSIYIYIFTQTATPDIHMKSIENAQRVI